MAFDKFLLDRLVIGSKFMKSFINHFRGIVNYINIYILGGGGRGGRGRGAGVFLLKVHVIGNKFQLYIW